MTPYEAESEKIVLKVVRDLCDIRALAHALGFKNFQHLRPGQVIRVSPSEHLAVSKLQAEYRRILGIDPPGPPDPDWLEKVKLKTAPPELNEATPDPALFG